MKRATVILRDPLAGYLAAFGMPVAAIFVLEYLRLPPFVFQHAIVLIVVGFAVQWGMRVAILTALIATLAENVFLREPIGRPAVDGLRGVLDLVLFVVVAVSVGWLVRSAREQRSRAESAAAREREALAERDRIIDTIAHDLAAPLTAIRGTLVFIRHARSTMAHDLERFIARVDIAAHRATSLLSTLRDVRLADRGALVLNLRTVDLRATISPVVDMFSSTSGCHPVRLALPLSEVWVRADEERLQRVLENLLSNAIKYSPDGGAVEVTLAATGVEAVVSVRDYGIGISEEARPHIFERSYRAPEAVAAAPGLGLGLSIAAEIVHRHGGTMGARGLEPRGSVVWVSLPLCHERERLKVEESAAPQRPAA